jgi:hypothetical protein
MVVWSSDSRGPLDPVAHALYIEAPSRRHRPKGGLGVEIDPFSGFSDALLAFFAGLEEI